MIHVEQDENIMDGVHVLNTQPHFDFAEVKLARLYYMFAGIILCCAHNTIHEMMQSSMAIIFVFSISVCYWQGYTDDNELMQFAAHILRLTNMDTKINLKYIMLCTNICCLNTCAFITWYF